MPQTGIDSQSKLDIFPAQGLKFGNTWFSEEKEISEDYPGRKYIGILAPGYPSTQTTIVRVYSSILQKVKELSLDLHDNNKIDYYWTLLSYFNSIRAGGFEQSLKNKIIISKKLDIFFLKLNYYILYHQ